MSKPQCEYIVHEDASHYWNTRQCRRAAKNGPYCTVHARIAARDKALYPTLTARLSR